MNKTTLITLLAIANLLLAQTNPLVSIITNNVKERILYSLAQKYCETKIRWEQFYYTATSLKPALDAASAKFNDLVSLLKPGGRLYNLIDTWYTNYINGFRALNPLVSSFLVNLQGLISASNAASNYLNGMYGSTLRSQLIQNYVSYFSSSLSAIQNYMQNYMGNEMMAQISNVTQLLHYKEMLVTLNVTQVTSATVNNLNLSLISSVTPTPQEAWYSFATCSTDYANNTYKLCFTDINSTGLYGPLFVGFQTPVNYNVYLRYYSAQLGGSCPVNYIQIHTYMVQLYNLYVQIYNQYSTNVMPWEIRLIVAQNVLQGILGSLANDLLSPLTTPLNKLSNTVTSSIVKSCLSPLSNINPLANAQSLSLRSYPYGIQYLTTVANDLVNIYQKLYDVVDCINFYIPRLQTANQAYLNALNSKFRAITGTDIETWAASHGIQCQYVPSTNTASSLELIIQNYIAILDPASPSSFVNTILTNTSIVSFPNIIPPTSLSEGGICG